MRDGELVRRARELDRRRSRRTVDAFRGEADRPRVDADGRKPLRAGRHETLHAEEIVERRAE